MSRGVDIVIDSYGDERQAVNAMHRQARVLRQRKVTHRFGVSIEKHRGVWWLILHDREAINR